MVEHKNNSVDLAVAFFPAFIWAEGHMKRRMRLYEKYGARPLLPLERCINSPTIALNQKMAKLAAVRHLEAFHQTQGDIFLHVASGGFWPLLHFQQMLEAQDWKRVRGIVLESAPMSIGLENFTTYVRQKHSLPRFACKLAAWMTLKYYDVAEVSPKYMSFYQENIRRYPPGRLPILLLWGEKDPLMIDGHIREYASLRTGPVTEVRFKGTQVHASLLENFPDEYRHSLAQLVESALGTDTR